MYKENKTFFIRLFEIFFLPLAHVVHLVTNKIKSITINSKPI